MKSLIAAALLSALALLTACNTTEGAGRDLQSAGKAIAKSADEHK
ncbi:MAG: entericidin A/B family lipoprotein [Sphingomonadales bacterium]|jgi:predicted small secreted protein